MIQATPIPVVPVPVIYPFWMNVVEAIAILLMCLGVCAVLVSLAVVIWRDM